MTNFSTMKCLFLVAAAFLGCLQQSNAELQPVGNCSFMEYYCTVREHETCFFKRLYNNSTADCGFQFWIFYYRVLNKSKSCSTTGNQVKSPLGAGVVEIQGLYCNGFDLRKPLLVSLSPCSNKHKEEVDRCISDFAVNFSGSFSQRSLCRKRDEAKQCMKIAWRTYCNLSDAEYGILNDVIGSFNPFCEGDKDPKSEKSDQCVNYIGPPCQNPDDERCPRSNPDDDDNEGGMSGGAIAGIVIALVIAAIVLVVIIVKCRGKCKACIACKACKVCKACKACENQEED